MARANKRSLFVAAFCSREKAVVGREGCALHLPSLSRIPLRGRQAGLPNPSLGLEQPDRLLGFVVHVGKKEKILVLRV